MNDTIGLELKDWIPYRLLEESNELLCRWLYLGNIAFTEPFFDDTISKCRGLSENSHLKRSISSVEILPHWSKTFEAIPPSAIIFHISRCGSTVLSQLLGLSPANIVLSEVPFIDELLRWGFRNQTLAGVMPLVKSAIEFYGAKRNSHQQNLFIKTDSWHVHFYSYLRQLYPHTPIVLLYRRPDEVVRSQEKKRGMQAVPGVIEPALFGFDHSKILHLGLNEYMAMVVETYLAAFVEISNNDPLAIVANYNEGMIPVTQRVAAAAGIIYTDTEIAALQQRAFFHGKNPGEVFAEKAIAAQPPAYLEKCFQLYHQLENFRLTHQPTS